MLNFFTFVLKINLLTKILFWVFSNNKLKQELSITGANKSKLFHNIFSADITGGLD